MCNNLKKKNDIDSYNIYYPSPTDETRVEMHFDLSGFQ